LKKEKANRRGGKLYLQNMKIKRVSFPIAVLAAAVLVFGSRSHAADGDFPIYFQNSRLIVKAQSINRVTYLPLTDIISFMGLPYTDALALETLTVRSGTSRLVATRNSGLISLNDQIILLPSPIVRENDKWLGPVDYLSQGLSRLTGTDFRYRSGASRIFVGNVDAPELVMNAQSLGPITRLTVRSSVPINSSVQREEKSTRAVLTLNRAPFDALRETLDHRDRLVRSISFDDGDGQSKIVMELTTAVADIRVTPADNNRILFVDLMREAAVAPPPPATSAPANPPVTGNPVDLSGRRIRVIVIDPGHGGIDVGAQAEGLQEKDLTLLLARKLRTTLQTRLGATVLLTRDADVAMDNEARSAVANNNQANLFISLHVGYSPNKADAGSSVFIMKEDFGNVFAETAVSRDQLFLPWYLGYRLSRRNSAQAARIFQEQLSKAMPGSGFPVRNAPLAVLSSATMPSLLLEVGNLNNPVNAQTLMDGQFQNRFVGTVLEAVQRFSEIQQPAAN
jgi:N-acetylmuramoyl-L-alanine amidase